MNCKTCRFWKEYKHYETSPAEYGHCRRYAPRVGSHRNESDEWPKTRPDAGCGEYQPISGCASGNEPPSVFNQSWPITERERGEVAEILGRRANDIASYKSDHRKDCELQGSVELALEREIARLRRLKDRIAPPQPAEEESN